MLMFPSNERQTIPTFEQLMQLKKKTTKLVFTEELDRFLKSFYERYNGDWERIANAISKPAGKEVSWRQVYDRYNYYLRDGINLSPLTPEEWSIIDKCRAPPLKVKFDIIAQYVGNGRTSKFLKNEWNKRQHHKENPNMRTRNRKRTTKN